MEVEEENDYSFKVLVLGESTVGKSSILLRFVDNTFSENFMATVGIDFKFKTILTRDKLAKLQIWDTAGQERFKSITYGFFRGANGILLVFDVANQRSFDKAQAWLTDIEKNTEGNIPVVLVGNKTDLGDRRQVSYAAAKEFADKHNLQYIECSAKTGNSVDKAFTTLVGAIVDARTNLINNEDENKVKLNGNKQSWSCC